MELNIWSEFNQWLSSVSQFFSGRSQQNPPLTPPQQNSSSQTKEPADRYVSEAMAWQRGFAEPAKSRSSASSFGGYSFGLLPLGCAGTESSSSGGGFGGSTTNTDPDKDGDGFPEYKEEDGTFYDCDDNNPDIFPLKDNDVTTISRRFRRIEICNGSYYNASLRIVNSHNDKDENGNPLPPAQVFFRLPGIYMSGDAQVSGVESSIYIDNVKNVDFNVLHEDVTGNMTPAWVYLNNQYVSPAIHVKGSQDISIQNLRHQEGAFPKNVLKIEDSTKVTVRNVRITGDMPIVAIGVYNNTNTNNVVLDNLELTNTGLNQGGLFIWSHGTTIQNCLFSGVYIHLQGDNNEVMYNEVRNNNFTNTSSGVQLGGVNNSVNNNYIHHNQIGISVPDTTQNATFINNDLSNNATCFEIDPGAVNTSQSGNTCNNP